jgi:hypothetical protein
MSNDEIIEMARQAGMYQDLNVSFNQSIQNFAKLIAAKEREDIARYCIWLNDEAGYTDGYDFANAIRVKGQA